MARKNNTARDSEHVELSGTMSVSEAGKKGGRATSETHGREFYEEIGHKGGQRVRDLINQGKRAEGRSDKD